MESSSDPVPAALMGLAATVTPQTAAGQSSCSDCEECPYDDRLIYLRDSGGQVAWLYPQCEDLDCEELIPCMAAEDVDLDLLASAVDRADWSAIDAMIDHSSRISFHQGRNALVVQGCRAGSIAAILPVPESSQLAGRFMARVRYANLRRAVAAALAVDPAV